MTPMLRSSKPKEAPMPGTVAPRFQPLRELLEQQLAEGKHVGAAVAVYHQGELVADFWGGLADQSSGRPWQRDTTSIVFSTSKGLAATCLPILVERGQLSYDDLVSRHWPEFARNGKDGVTVRHVLAHQAGVPQQPEG